MDINTIMQAVSSVGFPIVCCAVLFVQNDKLRSIIEDNTKAVVSLTDYIKNKKED
jgi:hypothetical protein